MSPAICFDLDQSRILSSGNGLNVVQVIVYDRVENIVEKGENTGYQHFLLFT